MNAIWSQGKVVVFALVVGIVTIMVTHVPKGYVLYSPRMRSQNLRLNLYLPRLIHVTSLIQS